MAARTQEALVSRGDSGARAAIGADPTQWPWDIADVFKIIWNTLWSQLGKPPIHKNFKPLKQGKWVFELGQDEIGTIEYKSGDDISGGGLVCRAARMYEVNSINSINSKRRKKCQKLV